MASPAELIRQQVAEELQGSVTIVGNVIANKKGRRWAVGSSDNREEVRQEKAVKRGRDVMRRDGRGECRRKKRSCLTWTRHLTPHV